jgi:hypothetical protein
MVDFNKILAERKAAGAKLLEEAKKDNTPIAVVKKKPEIIDRLRHLINEHGEEMTAWEQNFCQDQFAWHKLNPGRGVSNRVLEKITEIEDALCGTMCHALNRAEIPHS